MFVMLLKWNSKVETHLRDFVSKTYGVELPELVVEAPPNAEMGDLAFPFPFELAKVLRRPPRAIAEDVAAAIDRPGCVERFEAAGGGYLNVFFHRSSFLKDLSTWLGQPVSDHSAGKIIVEHTNINPNKAAHIGHLRNAALGDSFVRILRERGREVEVQNYIDNTGVQVADVVVGFEHLRNLSLEDVKDIPEPFDYYCWDLYAEVSEWFDQNPDRRELRHNTLHAIESGEGPTAALAEYIAARIVRAHLDTMIRLGVKYDVLPRESEILQLKFWDHAFEQLKASEAIHFTDTGPHAGCWVMLLPEQEGQPEDEKIIVRSNGTVTYVGKDIAYQLWKFGLLGKTFFYKPFSSYSSGETVWVTTGKDDAEGEAPVFGDGSRVYNVIDVRQSYLQRVVVQGLRSLGFSDEAENSTHYSYEMVALTPKCCQELGIELNETDQKRSYVEVSGRKGLGVKADDLIDKLIEKSRGEVDSRQPGLAEEQKTEIAQKIAIGALRYFLLKYTRNSVIAFDFGEALSFEGETGPYLQYSVVRANNIFRKMSAAKHNWNWDEWVKQKPKRIELLTGASEDFLGSNEIWSLLLQAARTDLVLEQCERSLEVSLLAKHAFTLAQQFNLFYHKHHILSEPDLGRQDFYLIVADLVRQSLTRVLDLLGIEVPERM
jgi:arginyl-tRNA synthetase